MADHHRWNAQLSVGSIVVTAFPAQAADTVIGIGADSCGTWTADRANRNQASADTEWVLGYVAGVGFLSGSDPLSGLDFGAVTSWVNNYCAARPLDLIFDAATALAIELSKRHGVIIQRTQLPG
jgi:hypothetical protein